MLNDKKTKLLQLCKEPSSAKVLHNKLKKLFGISMTYQAVHKMATQLVEEEALIKEGSAYVINPSWIGGQKKFLSFLESHSIDPIEVLHVLESKESYSFIAHTQIEMGMFCLHFLRLLQQRGVKGPVYSHMRFVWSPLPLDSHQFKELQELIQGGFIIFTLLDDPYGRWMSKHWVNSGAQVRLGALKEPFFHDLFCMGEYVLQVTWPQDAIDDIIKDSQTIDYAQEFDYSDLYKAIHLNRYEIRILVKKNPALAKSVRETCEEMIAGK